MRTILAFAAAVAGCTAQNLGLEQPDLAPAYDFAQPQGGPFGTLCISSRDCASGICIAGGRCSSTCTPGVPCPGDWACTSPGGVVSPVFTCQCTPTGSELCNGRDDDCNGLVDDSPLCGMTPACVTPTGTLHLQLVTNQITVPTQRTDFAFDLNGDGKADNQYGNILGALAAQGLMPQNDTDADVAAGRGLLLLDERSTGAISDPCVGVEMVRAADQTPPNFTGSGSYARASGALGANFLGAITQSRFSAASPATAAQPLVLDVRLPGLAFGAGSVDARLTAAHISYTRSAAGAMRGEVHGAITKDDITKVVRNVATLVNQRVTTDPTSSNSKQILLIFDQGCSDPSAKNFDGSAVAKSDGKIAECEVATNAIIKNVLAPDVDLFALDGSWRPNPANTDKDSLSVGFGFTAVGARF